MDKPNISPVAAHVIKKCGGVSVVARLSGRAPVSVHKWRYDKKRGGTGGLVPAEAQERLMAAALRGEVDLTPADFFDMGECSPEPTPEGVPHR